MTRVSVIDRPASGPVYGRRSTDRAEGSSSRALVPVGPVPAVSGPRGGTHHDAPFIAQLLATAEQAPMTRKLRRASPTDAKAAYQAAYEASHDAPQESPAAPHTHQFA